ncbi:MAG: response regulator [Dehalococcoidia bacterium]
MQTNTLAAEVVARLATAPDGVCAVEVLAKDCGRSVAETGVACELLERWGVLAGVVTDGLYGVALPPGKPAVPLPIVMVVENTAAVAHVVGALLESDGYHVLIASSLPIGLGVARALRLSLVIADSFSGTGRQALERLRELREAAEPAPVLLFTAHRDVGEEAARAAGYTGVLPKPFDIDDLLMRVADVLKAEPAG